MKFGVNWLRRLARYIMRANRLTAPILEVTKVGGGEVSSRADGLKRFANETTCASWK